MLVVSSNQVPAKTLKELVELPEGQPDKVSGGTAGMGSGSHIGALAFNAATGATYQLVPYRGTGPAMQDLIANQIQVMVDQSSNSLPQVTGRQDPRLCRDLRQALAGHARHPDGGRGRLSAWRSRSGTACGRPRERRKEIIDKLNAAAVAALKDPAVRKRMEELGQDLPTAEEMAPAAFAAFQKAEFAKWKPIIEKAGVKIE